MPKLDVPYMDWDKIEVASEALLAIGFRILEGCRLADTDEAHVSKLLDFFDPAPGAVILDQGAGFGEVARLMKVERPDLDFELVNLCKFQHEHSPAEFKRHLCDFHYLPHADASVDGCMFCYSLCHSDFDRALQEAARVTRPGGQLFVYDFTRFGGDNDLMAERLGARALTQEQLSQKAHDAGWGQRLFYYPDTDDSFFRAAYGNPEEYDRIFSGVKPVLWKATKE